MIKTISSYYINVPLVSPLSGLTCSSFVLKLYVWSGLKSDVPAEPTYELTEQNPETLTTSLSVNISRLINDLIVFSPQVITTNYQNGNNQIWVKREVYYNTQNFGEADSPQNVSIDLAVKGYGYAMEGINPQLPADKILLTNREFKVSNDTKFIVPILLDETVAPSPSITIDSVTLVSGNEYEIAFSFVGNYDEFPYTLTPASGLPEITEPFPPVSPQTIVTNLTGSVDIVMYGFDNDSGSNVTSNTFNIVI